MDDYWKKVTSHKLPAPVNLLLRVCVFEGGWGVGGRWVYMWRVRGGGGWSGGGPRLWATLVTHASTSGFADWNHRSWSMTETTGPGRWLKPQVLVDDWNHRSWSMWKQQSCWSWVWSSFPTILYCFLPALNGDDCMSQLPRDWVERVATLCATTLPQLLYRPAMIYLRAPFACGEWGNWCPLMGITPERIIGLG